MPKKRYQSSAEIERDIDICLSRARRLLAMADALDDEADRLFKNPRSSEKAKVYRAAASARRKLATRLMDKKAKGLKAKLAEFNTVTMFGLDPSIPAGVRY